MLPILPRAGRSLSGRRSLHHRLHRLEEQLAQRQLCHSPVLTRLRADLTGIMQAAGLRPDPWQQRVLCTSAARMLLLCSRQVGKSTVSAALALGAALLRPRSPVLVLSPSARQSGELFRKILDLFNVLGRPMGVLAANTQHLHLANGSRIVSLPGTERTVRCFSEVAVLIIDEAARVPDALYAAVRPMLAVSQGRLVALSTPFGKRGWFHDAWHGEGEWERIRITAAQCPRISAAFLAEERRALGERWYRQEYDTSFESTIDAVFAYDDIQAALCDDVKPLFRE